MFLLLPFEVLFCESTPKELGLCIFGWTKVPPSSAGVIDVVVPTVSYKGITDRLKG